MLHRGCNALLGHIENNCKRNGVTPERLTNLLHNAASYITTYKNVLHPTHLTPEEKAARTKRKAKRRRENAKKAKAEKTQAQKGE